MTIPDFLSVDQTTVTLQAADKDGAIREMVDLLATSPLVTDQVGVLDSVLDRERTMSTGIGHGVAIPHGKTGGVSGLVAGLGISKQGIDFESIDGQPVHIIVLMAAPLGPAGPHIQALSRISRVLNHEEARRQLLQAATPEEALRIFVETEQNIPTP